MQDLLESAISKVKAKISPAISSKFVPEEQYKQLFQLLDVWEEDSIDEDVNKRAKFIYDFLGDSPRDKILHIYTELGATPPNEKKLDRVYKYCRLKEQADKALLRYEQLNKDIHAISTPRQ